MGNWRRKPEIQKTRGGKPFQFENETLEIKPLAS